MLKYFVPFFICVYIGNTQKSGLDKELLGYFFPAHF